MPKKLTRPFLILKNAGKNSRTQSWNLKKCLLKLTNQAARSKTLTLPWKIVNTWCKLHNKKNLKYSSLHRKWNCIVKSRRSSCNLSASAASRIWIGSTERFRIFSLRSRSTRRRSWIYKTNFTSKKSVTMRVQPGPRLVTTNHQIKKIFSAHSVNPQQSQTTESSNLRMT